MIWVLVVNSINSLSILCLRSTAHNEVKDAIDNTSFTLYTLKGYSLFANVDGHRSISSMHQRG